jgi:hypothetical protein
MKLSSNLLNHISVELLIIVHSKWEGDFAPFKYIIRLNLAFRRRSRFLTHTALVSTPYYNLQHMHLRNYEGAAVISP